MRYLPDESISLSAATLGLTPAEAVEWFLRVRREPLLRQLADGTDPWAEEDDFQTRVDRLARDVHLLARQLNVDP